MPENSLRQLMTFFDMPPAQFAREWKALDATAKAELKAGVLSGSLTY